MSLKIQKIKAFVQLKPGIKPTQEVKDELFAYCRKNIAKYSMPYDIEFREELPVLSVGKVAYKILEQEEADRRVAEAQAKAMETVLPAEAEQKAPVVG